MCSVIWWVLCWWPVREPTVVSEPRSSSSAQRGWEGTEIRERSTGAGNKAAGSDLHSTAERHRMPNKRRVTERLQSCREQRCSGMAVGLQSGNTRTHTQTGNRQNSSLSVCVCVCLREAKKKEKQDCTRRKTESWVIQKYQTLNKHMW